MTRCPLWASVHLMPTKPIEKDHLHAALRGLTAERRLTMAEITERGGPSAQHQSKVRNNDPTASAREVLDKWATGLGISEQEIYARAEAIAQIEAEKASQEAARSAA